MRLYLVGFMGAGKTEIGKGLAEVLGTEFIDLDKEIENREGSTIPDIFEKQGEQGFRLIEAELLRQTAKKSVAVISTGGGTPCFFDNMAWINSHGVSIYLNIPPKELFRRLSKNRSSRPLIRTFSEKKLQEFISATLAERAIFYEQAHLQSEPGTSKSQQINDLAAFLGRFLPCK